MYRVDSKVYERDSAKSHRKFGCPWVMYTNRK